MNPSVHVWHVSVVERERFLQFHLAVSTSPAHSAQLRNCSKFVASDVVWWIRSKCLQQAPLSRHKYAALSRFDAETRHSVRRVSHSLPPQNRFLIFVEMSVQKMLVQLVKGENDKIPIKAQVCFSQKFLRPKINQSQKSFRDYFSKSVRVNCTLGVHKKV